MYQLPPNMESLKLQVEEARNFYTVAACMPGVRREDVDIALGDDRTLRIAAIRREMDGMGGERIININRSYILPKFADPDNMRADLVDSNLTIVIHKMSDLIDKKKPRLS